MKDDNQPVTLSPEAKAEAEVQYWLGELDAARKREKTFRKEGCRITELYEGQKKSEYQYNILFSNTETYGPALYNATPRPVVERRFKDEDPVGLAAARASQRTLEYLLDDGMGEYATFDELMKSAVLEALVPGRGLTRFKYDAKIEQVQNAKAAEAAEASGEVDPDEDAEREGQVAAPAERVSYETVCAEEIPWDRFLHGYAKKWRDVPWIAYEWFMTKEELEQNFGPAGVRVPVAELESEEESETGLTGAKGESESGQKVAVVYEIWDKRTRTVIFLTPNWKDAPLKSVPDPLGLSGFFNCPRPLQLVEKISCLTPVALYTFYEEQAKELNRVTLRINRLISALKNRGFYDATIEGIEKVLEAEDNVLIPAENVAALQQGSGLDKAIFLMPIEKLIAVLQQLYLQREQVKQVIYELTGIADIMRGSTQASETLGAQQLKNQWGTLRLKRPQKEVGRYARDCLRIMLEIAVTKLSPETLKAMTGLPFPTGQEKAQAQMIAQQSAMQGIEPPPEVMGALSEPSWDEILSLLQNDLQRSYRVDIETNSTVDVEATEDKENIAELLNALSQFLNGVAPLIEQGVMTFDVAQGMMLAIVRRFRFGPELEGILKQMQPPAPQQDPKLETEKLKMEQAREQHALDMEAKRMELDFKRQELEMELEVKRAELNLQAQSMQQKAAAAEHQHGLRMQEMAMQASMPKAQPRSGGQGGKPGGGKSPGVKNQ